MLTKQELCIEIASSIVCVAFIFAACPLIVLVAHVVGVTA